MIRKRLVRWALWTAGVAVTLVLLTVAVVTGLLRASLPKLDGELRAAGVRSSLVIERDDLGVPTLTASNRHDVVYGLGFVHAQDRFFQMDLSRRVAAGELAALMGPAVLEQDKRLRRLRLRHTATRALAALPADQRELATAYAEGVNAGLASLNSRPPEYWVLRMQPQPWQPEDTLLAALAMTLALTPPPLDRVDTFLHREIGPAVFDFFYPRGTDWDATLDGSIIPPSPIPDPDAVDFRKGWEPGDSALPDWWKRWVRVEGDPDTDLLAAGGERESRAGFVPGSNGFAVDGSVSSTHAALVASDMHLNYRMPPPFYRVRLKWTEKGRALDVIALTLPGTPAAATGSNGRVAWAPTNAVLDIMDHILLEIDPDAPERYRVPGGWAEMEKITERIEVRGGAPAELPLRWTRWGPVIDKNASGAPFVFDGHPVVLKLVFTSPEAVNLRFFDLMLAQDTDEALRIASESGVPVINVVVGDNAGKIGWTIAGQLPRRMGKAGSQIVSWADGQNGWDGWLTPGEHPRVSSPAVSRVFSGNQRKLGTELYVGLAHSDPVLGARSKQIRDALADLTNATPADMLAIQLDDRALLLEPWRQLLLTTLRDPKAATAITNDFAEVVRYVSDWNGRATADAVGYRLVRGFRLTVLESVFEPLTVKVSKALGQRVGRHLEGGERPVWALLGARPPHLLNPRFSNYDDLLLTATRDVVKQLQAVNQGNLGRATWGQSANQRIQHPFSDAVPALSRWLGASTEGCSGGDDMPRVHAGGAGAVERLVVSPGHEAEGLCHMPGGQSGHFLSPFYRAGHDAWVHGKPTPLLPGPARHKLRLVRDGTAAALKADGGQRAQPGNPK